MKRIAVIGSGYVGLVSGAMFAAVGNRVVCVDKDPAIVNTLKEGKCNIHEPGLEEILKFCNCRRKLDLHFRYF